MNFINPPAKTPPHMKHRTFYSQLYNREIGCNIWLPPGYEESGERYPAAYHLHGWTGDESSEIWTMKKEYEGKRAIAVFPNSSPVIESFENLPVEAMLIDELIPHIDMEYRTDASRESRSVSGFSMGGGMAFYLAVKYPGLFGAVTAYAGTYHHYYHKDYRTVGEAPERAAGIYAAMIREAKCSEKSILLLLNQNAKKIRDNLRITIRVGTADVLFCDNEILRLHLNLLNIPHEYTVFDGVGHELKSLV